MSRSAWDLGGSSFDRALRDAPEEIVITETSGNGCPRGPCVADNSLCGDVGSCPENRRGVRQ